MPNVCLLSLFCCLLLSFPSVCFYVFRTSFKIILTSCSVFYCHIYIFLLYYCNLCVVKHLFSYYYMVCATDVASRCPLFSCSSAERPPGGAVSLHLLWSVCSQHGWMNDFLSLIWVCRCIVSVWWDVLNGNSWRRLISLITEFIEKHDYWQKCSATCCMRLEKKFGQIW